MWIVRGLVTLCALLLMGCANSDARGQPAANEPAPAIAANAEGVTMSQNADLAQAILGAWTKHSADACAEKYADTIQFDENGLFSASGGAIVFWDAGHYEIRSENAVMISNAYDAEIVYRVSIDEGVLTFTDEAGCTFSYQRM
ncbi:MAG: hypothetical protein R2911_39380 [Caldilineaceae bacterium]